MSISDRMARWRLLGLGLDVGFHKHEMRSHRRAGYNLIRSSAGRRSKVHVLNQALKQSPIVRRVRGLRVGGQIPPKPIFKQQAAAAMFGGSLHPSLRNLAPALA